MRETSLKRVPVIGTLRVLLVEDSENDAMLLLRELRRGGYKPLSSQRVYTPEDMEEALRAADARDEPFQVVISDYYMPRFSAPDALRLLRELGYDVPFIVVSGKIGEDAAVETMKAGANDYLTKENMSRLCPAIERELREAEVRRERERAEKALGRSEDRFRRLVEQIPAVTYVQEPIDSDTPKAITYMSPQYEAMLGYPAETEMLDEEHWLRVLHPDDRERVLAEELRTDETGEPYRIEYRLIARGGRVVWVRDEATLVRDEEGNSLYWLGVQYDITEQKRTEEEFRKSEERFRATFEQAAVGIVQVGLDGEWLRFNDKFCDIVGYEREELGAVSVFELVSPEDFERDFDRGVKMLAGELSDYTEEKLIVGKGRRRVWINLTVSLVHDDSGEPRYFIAVAEEIGKRMQAEEERQRTQEQLRQSEERFKVLAQEVVEGIVLSENGRIIDANRSLTEMFGYDLGELVGKDAIVLTPPEHREMVRRRISDEDTRPYESMGLKRDGTVFPIEIRPRHLPYSGRRIRVTSVIDLTERKHQEEALRQSEALYRTVVEQAEENIFLVDAKSRRVLDANDALLRSLGYTDDELQEMTLYDIVAHDQKSIDLNIGRIMEEGHRSLGERQYRRKDGSLADVEVNVSAVPYNGERAMCVVAHDVTQRKRAERMLEEIREAERNRLARELHDSTLQDIVYALQEIQVMQVVSGDDRDPALEDTADALKRSVEGLRGAIFELRLKETLDRSLVSSLENLVDLNRRMARGRYELDLVVEDDFPARLPGKTGQELTRLVQEALTNVRRHAEARHVRVELGLDGGLAYVEVSDDGRGFDAEMAGPGIGRQSMRHRALELGGEFDLESAPDEGTRVRFSIPVSRLVKG
ncbi:MAG: PAS domain S-box protein [Rubrobacteraceae bacterium]|nr:PAS domain S-box protein [Rubrobacteraceae bacterium]